MMQKKPASRMTISLRITRELYDKISQSAGTFSVNSTIVDRLERSYSGSDNNGHFRFLDAIKKELTSQARVTARFGLAIADGVEAVDVVLIDEPLAARITAVTGDDRKLHDAAKGAIEAAFPEQGMKWGEIAEALAALGAKAPAPALAFREALEKRLVETPAIAGQVAI